MTDDAHFAVHSFCIFNRELHFYLVLRLFCYERRRLATIDEMVDEGIEHGGENDASEETKRRISRGFVVVVAVVCKIFDRLDKKDLAERDVTSDGPLSEAETRKRHVHHDAGARSESDSEDTFVCQSRAKRQRGTDDGGESGGDDKAKRQRHI